MKIAALSIAALAAAGIAAATGLYAVPAGAGASSDLRIAKPSASSTTGVETGSGTLDGGLTSAASRPGKYLDAEDPAVGYTQHGSTVTAHEGDRVVATITQRSLSRAGSHGRFVITVTVKRPFRLEAQDFVWEDDLPGDQNPPVNSSRIFEVEKATQIIVLAYRQISGEAAVAWEPGLTTAGVWPVIE